MPKSTIIKNKINIVEPRKYAIIDATSTINVKSTTVIVKLPPSKTDNASVYLQKSIRVDILQSKKIYFVYLLYENKILSISVLTQNIRCNKIPVTNNIKNQKINDRPNKYHKIKLAIIVIIVSTTAILNILYL